MVKQQVHSTGVLIQWCCSTGGAEGGVWLTRTWVCGWHVASASSICEYLWCMCCLKFSLFIPDLTDQFGIFMMMFSVTSDTWDLNKHHKSSKRNKQIITARNMFVLCCLLLPLLLPSIEKWWGEDEFGWGWSWSAGAAWSAMFLSSQCLPICKYLQSILCGAWVFTTNACGSLVHGVCACKLVCMSDTEDLPQLHVSVRWGISLSLSTVYWAPTLSLTKSTNEKRSIPHSTFSDPFKWQTGRWEKCLFTSPSLCTRLWP